MTLICETRLEIPQLYLHTENEHVRSRHSKLRARTTHTDRVFALVTLILTRYDFHT